MAWFYAIDGNQKGPVEEAALQSLVTAGTITAETLVWREGMAEWQPYGRIAAASAAAAPDAPPRLAQPDVACSECGRVFPLDQTIRLGQRSVCPDCKGAALQKMREGIGQNSDSVAIRQEHIKHEAS